MRTMVIAALMLGGCAAGPESRQLRGGEWQAVNINGVPVIAGSNLTLRLDGATIAGNSGCNIYSGTFERRSRDRIRVGAISQTEMACVDAAMMDQESRFASIVRAAEGYSFYGDGGISLIAADGRAIRFRRVR